MISRTGVDKYRERHVRFGKVDPDTTMAKKGENVGEKKNRERNKPWSGPENAALKRIVGASGTDLRWGVIAKQLNEEVPGSDRTYKQCWARWFDELDPSIDNRPLRENEKRIIRTAVESEGHQFSHIASGLPGRTPNQVKNFYFAEERKKNRREENSQEAEQRKKARREKQVVGRDLTGGDVTEDGKSEPEQASKASIKKETNHAITRAPNKSGKKTTSAVHHVLLQAPSLLSSSTKLAATSVAESKSETLSAVASTSTVSPPPTHALPSLNGSDSLVSHQDEGWESVVIPREKDDPEDFCGVIMASNPAADDRA